MDEDEKPVVPVTEDEFPRPPKDAWRDAWQWACDDDMED